MSERILPTEEGAWWAYTMPRYAGNKPEIVAAARYLGRIVDGITADGPLVADVCATGETVSLDDPRIEWLVRVPDPTVSVLVNRFIVAHTAQPNEMDDDIEFAAGGDPKDGRDVLIELLATAIYAKKAGRQ